MPLCVLELSPLFPEHHLRLPLSVLNALPETGRTRDRFASALEAMERGDPGAYREMAALTEALNDRGLVDSLRTSVQPQDRMRVALALEDAMEKLADSRAVDAGAILRDSPTIRKAQVDAFVRQLDSMSPEEMNAVDVDFGVLRPDIKKALNEIRTEEGVSLITGDNLVIPANMVRKLYRKRMLEEGLTADRVARTLLNVFHGDADFVSAGAHSHIQAIVALRNELADIGFIGINPTTGETVIKSGFIVHSKNLGKKIRRVTAQEGRSIPSSEKLDAEAPHLPGRDEFSALQSGDSLPERIASEGQAVNSAGQPREMRGVRSLYGVFPCPAGQ